MWKNPPLSPFSAGTKLDFSTQSTSNYQPFRPAPGETHILPNPVSAQAYDEGGPGLFLPLLSEFSNGPTQRGGQKPLTDRKAAEFRRSLIAIERVLGRPVKEVAEKYRVRPGEVRKITSDLEKAGFYEAFEGVLLDIFVPKAFAVYEAQLDMGELSAARDILFGLGILRKDPQPKVGDEIVESLTLYRRRRAEGVLAAEGRALEGPPECMDLPKPTPLANPSTSRSAEERTERSGEAAPAAPISEL